MVAYEILPTLNFGTMIAAWGACLSTALAGIKIWETFRSRFRIEVGGCFTSASDIGNTLRIRNISPNPIILTYWVIFYGSGKWPFREEKPLSNIDYDSNDLAIQPSATCTLEFTDEEYFSTAPSSLKGRSIYIRLHFAGRREPIVRKVYPF